jgi:hypothetical protein
MVTWGDDEEDAMRVIEPIPAGFEYLEDSSSAWGREEVRNGAVIHFLTNSALPQTFQYYLRPESAGRLIALPATAEYLRRPATRGQTPAATITVVGEK